MKKNIIIFLIMIIIIMSSIIFISANGYDCRSVSQEFKDFMDLKESESIIHIYNGAFLQGFASGEDIEDLTNEKYVIEELYVKYNQADYESATCYKINDFVANKVTGSGIERAAKIFARLTNESTIVKLEKKIKSSINTIVCLCGETSHDGIYIYLITNNGEYVLYKEDAASEETYLFPVNEFNSIAKELFEAKINARYNQSGEVRKGSWVRIADIMNVDKYDLYFESNYSWIIIVSLFISVVFIFMVLFVIKKRKTKFRQQKDA